MSTITKNDGLLFVMSEKNAQRPIALIIDHLPQYSRCPHCLLFQAFQTDHLKPPWSGLLLYHSDTSSGVIQKSVRREYE
jgi:hypothetical protein